ncbi:sulfatase-like hydrolase/transferase [Acidovorax sp. MR-S7]|uniref:sulfatase-like hydrolase/transferase n=1 Tax=Acidovorax sp. MR-S7 TaxID=1268622 RepID=UPI0011875BA7|nr:sulfatase-like hydrolase/transferase [Acidovorax sp. MR-S7]
MFEWVSIHFGYKRYLISLELLLAFIVAAFGWWWLGGVIFFLAIGWEAILGASSILFLFDYSQFKTIAKFIFEARPAYVGGVIVFLMFAVVLYCGGCHFLKKVSRMHIISAVIFLVFLQIAFSFRDGNFLFPALMDRGKLIVGSSIYFSESIVQQNRQIFNLRSHDNVEYVPIGWPSAFMQIFGKVVENKAAPSKVLFIIAESWGRPNNEVILDAQIGIIKNSRAIRDVRVGTVHAIGATAFAEFRELCGKVPTKLNLEKISEEHLGECYPRMLGRQGYKTISVHGAHGVMYDRLLWYPVVGFGEMIFKEVLPISQDKQCYSFPGYCDENLFGMAGDKLNSAEKVFLYWLTLNSHMPYDRRDISKFRESLCDDVFDAGYKDGLCNYHNLHVQFFEGLAKLVQRKELSGVEVVVVGDHPPIFGDDLSKGYFKMDEVPFLHFRIK